MGEFTMEPFKRLGALLFAAGIAVALGYGYWAEYYHWPPVTFIDIRGDRAELLAGIQSYQSPAEFLASPVGTGCQWIRDVGGSRQVEGAPPFNLETLACSEFTDLEHPGLLQVTFYNNRLMETAFSARVPESYREAFEKRYGVRVNRFDRVFAGQNREVSWFDQDPSRARLILGDERLWHERTLWLKRYE